jgi:hypothetical protein
MSKLYEPRPVKLFMGLIYSEDAPVDECIRRLEETFGQTDFIGERYAFEFTSYYEKEMGKRLFRRFLSFEKLIKRDDLINIKVITNKLEKDYSLEDKRRINIDPGYIAREHLILATGKAYYHRPYLGKGVYADLTLVYRDKQYQPLEWTYPDYRSEEIRGLMKVLRDKYILDLSKEQNA